MDRAKLWQILRKEFAIPKGALRLSLLLSIVLNLGFFFIIIYLANLAYMRGFEAQWIGDSAARELARTDAHFGRPRYLRVEWVESGSRGTSLIEETDEIKDGLPVWAWRCVDNDWSPSMRYVHAFVAEYNNSVSSYMNRNRSRD